MQIKIALRHSITIQNGHHQKTNVGEDVGKEKHCMEFTQRNKNCTSIWSRYTTPGIYTKDSNSTAQI